MDRLVQDAYLDTVRTALAPRFRIEREVGRGGTATVYLAYDSRHERQVAIKVLRPELAAAVWRDRFFLEVKLTTRLSHPHILKLLESGEADGVLYYVMPYIPGESLRARIRRERQLPLPDAIRITGEVAEALAAAHAQGVVHRDIKPENILFEAGHALVADFGIAKAITEAAGERLSTTGLRIGTPGYMSPEQATGEANLDHRSDVYSLAVVLYEMLAGEPPYNGPTAQAIFAKQLSQPVPPLRVVRETVSTALEEVVCKALAKVPADRYGSVAEFASAVSRARQISPWIRWVLPVVRIANWVFPGGRSRMVPVAVGGGLVVVGLLAGVSRLARPKRNEAALDPRHIAVLYFDDRTPGKTLGHVANGLTEDLIDRLSQVSALSVVSPNGVRPYVARATPVDSLARTLGVGTIVGGSVARSGAQLRVTVRLIDPTTGQQLHTRTLEQPWEDLFSLQDKLTSEVAQFLRERLGREIRVREQRASTKSVQAWEFVQQGEDLAAEGAALIRAGDETQAAERLWRADTLFVRAGQLDPHWVVPMVGRGRVAYSLAFVSPGPGDTVAGISSESRTEASAGVSVQWLVRGIQYAEVALRRDPWAPEALALRGELRHRLVVFGSLPAVDTLVPLSEGDLLAALRSRPDYARAWHLLGEVYNWEGRFPEAVRALQRALDADAYLTEIRSVIALLFAASLHSEQFEEARSWCRTGTERYPEDPRFIGCELTLAGWVWEGRRQVATAWRLLTDIERRDSLGVLASAWTWRRMMVAAVLARTGMHDSAVAVLDRTRQQGAERGGGPSLAHVEAYVRLLLGEREGALGLLAGYLQSQPEARAYVAHSPWYRALHADPRFRALVRPPG